MKYDAYSVTGDCRGCGSKTHWNIGWSFPLCQECARRLVVNIAESMTDKEWETVSNYVDAFRKATVIGDVEG